MSFLKIRQVTLTGKRKVYVSMSAIAYTQELIPDQDMTWQVGEEPCRALIFLHQKRDPIICLERPEDIMKQVTVNLPDTQSTEQKLPKKSK